MKKLMNVFYALSPDCYLSLDGENLVMKKEKQIIARVPLHNLEQVVCFGYQGASPALMEACASRNVGLCFLSPHGRFLARVSGRAKGNVLLRKKQYRVSDCEGESVEIARNFLIGKIINCKRVIDRTIRDHTLVVDSEKLKEVSKKMRCYVDQIEGVDSINGLTALEGAAARTYFSVFNDLILQQKTTFTFNGRTRRPPTDNVNAMLSFFYSLLANETASALESVGLDPYVGFLHQDRPGRFSLALDLMEELRPVFADRLVLSLINRKQVDRNSFYQKESGAIVLQDDAKKTILKAWQERKQDQITHPFLKEKINFGLIPYAQALLLSRHLRGDLDAYPPFFWS